MTSSTPSGVLLFLFVRLPIIVCGVWPSGVLFLI